MSEHVCVIAIPCRPPIPASLMVAILHALGEVDPESMVRNGADGSYEWLVDIDAWKGRMLASDPT